LDILDSICIQWFAHKCCIQINTFLCITLSLDAYDLDILPQWFGEGLHGCPNCLFDGLPEHGLGVIEDEVGDDDQKGFRDISPQVDLDGMVFILVCEGCTIDVNPKPGICVHIERPFDFEIGVVFLEAAHSLLLPIIPFK
jgi:hypothetical protein